MDSTISRPLPQLPDEPILFLLNDFIALLTTLPDPSGRRGRRYALAPLLALALLAKFAQHSQLRAIAEWARLRQVELTTLLGLPRPTLPHPTTWTRRLAQVDPLALDALIGAFFAARLPCGPQRPGDIQLCIDGKTLRGTIPAGACQGVHLVAAYLPGTGCVLAQLEVQRKTNEIRVAPALLALLDLHGMVVTGDALLAQRTLSAQIVAAGGEYLWTVKSNQGELWQDIAWLFEPLRPGERAADWGWRSARVVSKGHGRIEEREIVVSSKLKGYSTWPGLEQVYKLTCRRTTARGKVTEAVRYGVTSLSAREASPQRLLTLTRGHWGIEGGLHGRRDVTLGEDRSQVRLGAAAHVLASLNNVVIGIVAQGGETNLAAARRAFEYHFHKLLFTPAPAPHAAC